MRREASASPFRVDDKARSGRQHPAGPFSQSRLGLTVIYALAAVTLIAVIGGGAFALLRAHFQTTTDQALTYMMVDQFRTLGVSVPADLSTVSEWPVVQGSNSHTAAEKAALDSDKERRETISKIKTDADLAAVFAMPLDSSLALRADRAPSGLPMGPELSAARAALTVGSDWRTISLPDGRRVRLFSHKVVGDDGVAVLQLGRTLADQDRVLTQLLLGLLQLGVISSAAVGAGAWWLAGRSIRPAIKAWERQQQFVANASHELRTPLSLISAAAEVAQRGLPDSDADTHQLLDDVLDESRHMSRLVGDLLVLSRLDSGDLLFEVRPVPSVEILGEASRQISHLAAQRGVDVEEGVAEGVVSADPERLRQALLAVLDNALRHTPPGGRITLASASVGNSVVLTIEDTGSGIPQEHLDHVFERFYRADAARGATGNTGLGLPIARELIEGQSGTIGLASALGIGTKVTITMPAACA